MVDRHALFGRGSGVIRAPPHAARLELVDQVLLAAAVEQQPDDERRQSHCDRGIGGPDVRGVWSQLHARHSAGWLARPALACTSLVRRALTRRRRTSLRMALRCRARNNTVMARPITSSGQRREGWMVGAPRRMTLACLFKQLPSTENLMTGRMTMPTRLR